MIGASMEFFSILWIGLLIACFVTLVSVSTTLAQANKDLSGMAEARFGSVFGWIMISTFGFGFWAFVCAALAGFGLDHGSGMGIAGLVGNVLLFAGPALYVVLGYQKIEAVNAKRKDLSSDSE